ncbi:hypothetical protein EPYR_01299 [Erwinia pyrifoliae DSM 12163]|nr:hypothetical protein EPYR_01299 [Erwinia pyrifoliae DSM 12163]
MIVTGMMVARRDADGQTGRRQQAFPFNLHLQHVAFHNNNLSPAVMVWQILGAGIRLFVAVKIRNRSPSLGRQASAGGSFICPTS